MKVFWSVWKVSVDPSSGDSNSMVLKSAVDSQQLTSGRPKEVYSR
jgi:hypothetical protein